MGDIEKIIENEQEWRRVIWDKLEKIEDGLSGMRVKVALLGGTCGLVGAFVINLIRSKIF